MKEITITLNVTEEQEKKLYSIIKDFDLVNYTWKDPLAQYPLIPKDCFQKGSDFDIDKKDENKDFLSTGSGYHPGFKNPTKSLIIDDIKDCEFPDDWVQEMDKKLFESFKYQEAMSLGNATKDEYTILKEKCIKLECKRLGVDKLNGYQLFILSAVSGFLSNTDQMLEDKESCLKFSITRMKEYIDKVEKELKEKEGFKFESIPPRKEKTYTEKDIDRLKSIIIETWMVIDGKGVKIGDCFKNWDFVDIIDGKVHVEKELKEKPVDGFINCTNATTRNNFNVYVKQNDKIKATSSDIIEEFLNTKHIFTTGTDLPLDFEFPKNVGAVLFNNGIFTFMTKDEIFEKYKDVLTKEQIKELYKN